MTTDETDQLDRLLAGEMEAFKQGVREAIGKWREGKVRSPVSGKNESSSQLIPSRNNPIQSLPD